MLPSITRPPVSWFKSEHDRVADELEKLYSEYRRLGRQLEADAEAAPYPHVGDRLQELVRAEERNARRVSERLAVLGRHAPEDGLGPIRSGRNSWERLVAMVEDYRSLVRLLATLRTRWDDESAEDARLVGTLRDSAAAHREAILDLVARSDPHAID